MAEEVIDCFADSPDVVLALYEGTWLGKDGVRKYFGRREDVSPEFIHQVMQLSPIIDVEANGEIAKGRWYSWGVVAAPAGNGVRQFFMGGIYECVYIKEGGKWKILRLEYSMQIAADPTEGWVSPERVAKPDPSARRRFEGPQPDIGIR
jgi:hypothetical protein